MTEIEIKIKKAFELSDLLYSRERDRISSELKKDLPMEKFCRHFSNPHPYLDLIDTLLKDEKNKLISYAKREVDIFQKQSESNVQKDE